MHFGNIVKIGEVKILIDLFSGAGGLSYGFQLAEFKIELAIELEKTYFESYKYNHPGGLNLNKDITKLDCKEMDDAYIKGNEVEGIIGGPPCIGFSSVGNRRPDDPRNMLVFFFIKWVEYFKPTFFVMENVKGILTMGKGQVVEKIKKMYNDIGYNCKMQVLLAAEYGVPQLRERVFFIGTKDNSVQNIKIKKSRRKEAKQKTLFEVDSLPPFLNVKDALSDILDIAPFIENDRSNAIMNYTKPPKTQYQEYLRKNSDKLYEHIAPNHSDEVIERISHIEQGKNHGSLPKEYQLKSGYPNIYGRLHLDRPADTITGNCGCVSAPGRFIHPTQNRAISVREAARLQSFPDEYRFFGNTKDKYKQVGNAVPPLMANAIAKAIKEALN
ncbi:MAG: DNA cytosine methyltransferase [Candidatus Lokiarchaeota archaeon]|nr:DNA cytosine methyltransferase [Candidatus Lokiarchaeota archaeon]